LSKNKEIMREMESWERDGEDSGRRESKSALVKHSKNRNKT
jgi:hypothetical protein